MRSTPEANKLKNDKNLKVSFEMRNELILLRVNRLVANTISLLYKSLLKRICCRNCDR